MSEYRDEILQKMANNGLTGVIQSVMGVADKQLLDTYVVEMSYDNISNNDMNYMGTMVELLNTKYKLVHGFNIIEKAKNKDKAMEQDNSPQMDNQIKIADFTPNMKAPSLDR